MQRLLKFVRTLYLAFEVLLFSLLIDIKGAFVIVDKIYIF